MGAMYFALFYETVENFVERLPPNAQAGSLDEAFCQSALREGRGPVSGSMSVPAPAGRSSGGGAGRLTARVSNLYL